MTLIATPQKMAALAYIAACDRQAAEAKPNQHRSYEVMSAWETLVAWCDGDLRVARALAAAARLAEEQNPQ